MAEGLEALLRSAQAALSAASATLPSAEGAARRSRGGRVVGGLWSRGSGEDRCRCGRAVTPRLQPVVVVPIKHRILHLRSLET